MSSLGRRVRVSARNPRAAGICDRCGQSANHADLAWQMRYAGASIVNTGLLVHRRGCLDPLNPLDKPLRIPPDSRPIRHARPEPMAGVVPDYLVNEAGIGLTDQNLAPLIVDDVTGDNEAVASDAGGEITGDDGAPIDVNLGG